jgi:hypothetical protein
LTGQATLESGLLHLPFTVDLLVKPRPTGPVTAWTDLVADDYFADGWAARPPYLLGANVTEHTKIMRELHRRLAHLSTQRLVKAHGEGGFALVDPYRVTNVVERNS